MPYLIAVLGIEKFGLIVMGQTIVGYFTLFVDYGFSLSATKEIAELKDDRAKTNEVFTSVLFAKLVLFVFGFILIHFLTISFDRLSSDYWIYILSYGAVFGNAVFPVWYFMGKEQMEYIAIFNILPKVIFLCLLFILIENEGDYILVPIIFSLGFVASGLLSLLYACKTGASLTPVSFSDIKRQFIVGWKVFVGMLSSSLTSNSIPLFLGFMTNNATLGTYSAVEKLIKPLANISNSLLNVIYPHMVNLNRSSSLSAIKFSLKVTIYYLVSLLFVTVLYFYFANFFIENFLELEFSEMRPILNLLIFLPFLTSFLNLFLISNCLVLGLKNVYSNSLFIVFIASLVIVPSFIYSNGMIGAPIAFLVIESLKILLMSPFLYLFMRRLKFE